MRVIARSTLSRFLATIAGSKDHRAIKGALDAWFHNAARANWKTPADVQRHFGSASVVSSDRVVFNIKGNDYRLVAAIDYRRQIVFIKWIGSHSDYDNIDVRTVEYEGKANQKRKRSR